MCAYLSNILYQLGKQEPIGNLLELQDNQFLFEILDEDGKGFKTYRSHEGSIIEWLKSMLKASFVNSPFLPSEIDLVIFASDSFHVLPKRMVQVGTLLNEVGLVNAYPLLVGFSECSNLQMAISIANSYVTNGLYKNILIISVDLASIVSPSSRIVKPGIAVMSDAVACCIITNKKMGWKIKSVVQKTHPLLLIGDLNRKADLVLRIDSHMRLFDELFEKTDDVFVDKVQKIFSSNFLPSVLTVILSNCGFKDSQIYFDNIPRNAHCLSSDCLINLKDFSNENPFNPNDHIVLYSEGPSQWGATLLEHT